MNKKKASMIIVGIVIFLVIIGGVFVFSSRNGSEKTKDGNATNEITIGTLAPNEIGLKLVLSNSNKKVKVFVEKLSDIKSLEYDISYEADIPASELASGDEGGRVERGFSDEVNISASQSTYESKEFDLGSCSRNVCRYDTGVNEVKIIMKVVKKDGKVYEVKDSVSL